MEAQITLRVDGRERALTVDTRTTLLDALRDRLAVTSPKKGCDHGQCGSCTVLVEGRRWLSCLALAVAHDGEEVTTAAGLPGEDGALHALQRAFVDHDALQCGYCTPGQVCSALGMFREAAEGRPSAVTADSGDGDGGGVPGTGPVVLDDAEIRERMSGNLCRCGAYVNIVAAVREVADR